jgi:hypothetical protein
MHVCMHVWLFFTHGVQSTISVRSSGMMSLKFCRTSTRAPAQGLRKCMQVRVMLRSLCRMCMNVCISPNKYACLCATSANIHANQNHVKFACGKTHAEAMPIWVRKRGCGWTDTSWAGHAPLPLECRRIQVLGLASCGLTWFVNRFCCLLGASNLCACVRVCVCVHTSM